MKPRVYIAGPYTAPDPCVNTRTAIIAADNIYASGGIPFVPHLAHFWHTVSPKPYEDWAEIGLAWIPKCNALLRLPGESPGSDAEVELAYQLGIPVFPHLCVTMSWCKSWKPT